MSYWIEDRVGFVGDLATSLGLRQLREQAGPKLLEFLDSGRADEALWREIVAEEEKGPAAEEVRDMLRGARPPLVITDGVIDVEEETDE